MPSLSVITTTGDRPQALALCARWMARQTIRCPSPGVEWIVCDNGATAAPPLGGAIHIRNRPCTLPENLLAGLERATGDRIAIVEDDDWYAPTHLETVVTALSKGGPGGASGGDAVGCSTQAYYHLPSRRWWTAQNVGACLCQTAINRRLLPLLVYAAEQSRKERHANIDTLFWRECLAHPQQARPLLWSAAPGAQEVVGMKGLPGRAGLGAGHRPGGTWNADSSGAKLREWVGEDAAVYEGLK